MSSITVPREFLSRLADEATKIVCNKADDITIFESKDDVAQFEQGLSDLHLACRSREIIVRARDAGIDAELDAELLRLPVRWVVGELHYEVSEHDVGHLDELSRAVEALREFADWSRANGLEAEAVSA